MSSVECEGLVKIYKTGPLEVFALQGLDLQVESGEMIAVIGSSGSGKSTLLNIIGSLERPSAGRCRVDGMDLQQLTPERQVQYRRTGVGFVWQQAPRNLIPYLSALENLSSVMEIAGHRGKGQRKWAMELLDAVGLAHRSHHRLSGLSGGEQQRLAIAIALANQPHLLLADEPTGSVDSETANRILTLLRQVNRRFGTTMIIVTHDTSVARMVDRYLWIQDGRVSQEAVRSRESDTVISHVEHVILDRTGRLQIPFEVLQRVQLGDRVQVQVEGDRVVIQRQSE